MARYCQDCGDMLGGRTSCVCGWTEDGEESDTLRPNSVRQRVIACCANGCPLPGTITESVSHKDAGEVNWYCIHHYRARHDPIKFNLVTEDLIRNPPQVEKGWHDVLIDSVL